MIPCTMKTPPPCHPATTINIYRSGEAASVRQLKQIHSMLGIYKGDARDFDDSKVFCYYIPILAECLYSWRLNGTY